MAAKRTILREQRLARKANRYSAYGREQEQRVKQILSDSGLFDDVILHEAYSEADGAGLDFTVRKGERTASFGITISIRKWHQHKAKHPNVPQFYFPVNVRPETVIRNVSGLLTDVERSV